MACVLKGKVDQIIMTGGIAYDNVMLPEALRLYREKTENGPVFDFHITYQGHGPYTTDKWSGAAGPGTRRGIMT